MAQLDLVMAEMSEVSKVTTDTTTAALSQPLEKLLAPHRMNVLQWQWAIKVCIHKISFMA